VARVGFEGESGSMIRTSITRRACAALAACALGAAVAAAAPAQGHADETELNTWNGVCRDVPGRGLWPEEPLHVIPVDTALVGLVDGGFCTGTLNGEQVVDVPLVARFDFRGVQSCEAADVAGTVEWTVGDVAFSGTATYRRAGIPAVVTMHGSAGGDVVAFLRGTTGAAPEDPRPAIDFVAGCAGEGIREAFFTVVRGVVTSTIKSPRPPDEDGDGDG
jgi:hypothetical protein